ncbi:MAG TPA: hypothetical protein VKP13_18650 [Nitrospira sp.]|nr:hypothetical protein [Nitrospira sp.]
MNAGWFSFVFGGGTWILCYGSLFLAFLMLMGTAVYACSDPTGPSAGPMLYFFAFVIMLVVTSVDVASEVPSKASI